MLYMIVLIKDNAKFVGKVKKKIENITVFRNVINKVQSRQGEKL